MCPIPGRCSVDRVSCRGPYLQVPRLREWREQYMQIYALTVKHAQSVEVVQRATSACLGTLDLASRMRFRQASRNLEFHIHNGKTRGMIKQILIKC
jgi:hypothetical protein